MSKKNKQVFLENSLVELPNSGEVLCNAYYTTVNGKSYIKYYTIKPKELVFSEPYEEAIKRKSLIEGAAHTRAEGLYSKLFARLPFDRLRATDIDKKTLDFSLSKEVYKKRMNTKVPMVVHSEQDVYVTQEVARLRVIEEKGLQVVSCFISSEVPVDVDEIRNMFSDGALADRLTYLEVGLIVNVVDARGRFKRKKELADRLGLDVSHMSRALALSAMPFEVQDMFYKGELSKSLLDSFKGKKVDDTFIAIARKAVIALNNKTKLDVVKKLIAEAFAVVNTLKDAPSDDLYAISPESSTVLARCKEYFKKGIELELEDVKRINQNDSVSSVEKGWAFNAYTVRKGVTQLSLGGHLGIADNTVSYHIALSKLPEYVQHLVLSGLLDVKKGAALARLLAIYEDNYAALNQAADVVMQKKYIVSETEKYVDDLIKEYENNRHTALYSLFSTDSDTEIHESNVTIATPDVTTPDVTTPDVTTPDGLESEDTPLSIKSVAAALRIKSADVRLLCDAGSLAYITKEGSTKKYVTKSELDRFISKQTNTEQTAVEETNSQEVAESEGVKQYPFDNPLVQPLMTSCMLEEVNAFLLQRNIAGLFPVIFTEHEIASDNDAMLELCVRCKGKANFLGFLTKLFGIKFDESNLYSRVLPKIKSQTIEIRDDFHLNITKEDAVAVVRKIQLGDTKDMKEEYKDLGDDRRRVKFTWRGATYLYTYDVSTYNIALACQFECTSGDGDKIMVTMSQGNVINESIIGEVNE